jgi:large subunit ribosomal protein LP1
LNALIKAAELDVEPIWASIFAKALTGKNVADMIANVGSAPAAAPAGGAAAGGAAAASEDKKEEAKKEEEEESDDDMGFGGLF